MEKNFESYEGIFAKLVNINSKNKIIKENLNCQHIESLDKEKINYKEYEYSKLNEQIRSNLKSINDYIIFNNENGFNYIFLCSLRYNEEILNNLNFNKKVNSLENSLQNKFINKYKNKYNLKIIK